ncbi:conserved hypothetical protein [Coccidioides posadasii str. Silveira]|uniref:Uncharacterized protein n=1 Tax=Coccidioides posadasii (strain RMSCC 757 / Silveira) TaxID=443226 RepID=E9DCT2_COCPS|nr:conserved hypothetical protein [Coccidioides posadasii str. Silveira]
MVDRFGLHGRTALFLAGTDGNGSVLRTLTSRHEADINVTDREGWTPLYAVIHNSEEEGRYSVEKKRGYHVLAMS